MEKNPVIELKDVAVFHSAKPGSRNPRKRGEMVVSGVNLTVYEGEMVYFIGKVGSGKSSLIKTLYAEIPLIEGEGRIVGFDLRNMKRRDISRLRRSIGIVFQDYQLLSDRDVFDNLHYVMKATGWNDENEMRRRIEEVLTVVGLENKAFKMPFELSGGQQQRVAIARTFMQDPQIILADEPIASLDPMTTKEVMDDLKKLNQDFGITVIANLHSVPIAMEYSDRIIGLRAGKLVYDQPIAAVKQTDFDEIYAEKQEG